MKCLNKVFQTIEINYTWMFSTFYICVTSCFSMNIRYMDGSLLHNFTKSYKKFSIFIVQNSGTHKETYSKCNKKNWIYGKRKAYIQTKMDKKVRRHQNIFIWIEVKYLLILVHPSLYFLSRIMKTGLLKILQDYVILDFRKMSYF